MTKTEAAQPDPFKGTYIPTSQADAERVAAELENAVQAAPSIDERERLLRLASAYWELSYSWSQA